MTPRFLLCPTCGARWEPAIKPTSQRPMALYCQRCGQHLKDIIQLKEQPMPRNDDLKPEDFAPRPVSDDEPPMHYNPAELECLHCGSVGPWALGQQDTHILMEYGGLDAPTTYREEDGSRSPFVLCDRCYDAAEKSFLYQAEQGSPYL